MQVTEEKQAEVHRIAALMRERSAILAILRQDDEAEDFDSYAVDRRRLELIEGELRRVLGS